MDKPTSNEIVSSIFRKYEGQFLSMPEMRNEVKKLSKCLVFQEPADPERTARTFYDKGFLQRDASSNYCYDSSKLSNSLKTEFCNYQYLYDQLPKNFGPTAFIKIPIGKVPENKNALDYLAVELKKYKESYGETNGIKYFTLKYAKEIDEKEIKPDELWAKTNTEPNTGKSNNLTSLFDIIKKNNEIDYSSDNKINGFTNSLKSDATLSAESTKNLLPTKSFEQIIFYGVPGCGKSFKIDNEKTKGATDIQKQKVVFHPDYTNSDFVGQIIPRMKETGAGESKKTVIEYSFKPGPFTTILRRALRDKEHQYFLLIEEINRGNAAAIFGDLFQLLDRDESGWSCSPVNNDDINFYVASKYEFWEENYSDSHEYDAECVNHPNGTEPFSRNTGIRLPPNLSIYATMNTNDQNVFTLDNAFSRRFKSEYISNKENPAIPEHCKQFNLMIGETEIRWGAFRNIINEKILQTGLANTEDKQLGLFFIKSESGKTIISEKDFADKVLKYLWHDVFKQDKDIFNGEAEISKFEDLIDNFKGSKAFENCFDGNFVERIKEINEELENE